MLRKRILTLSLALLIALGSFLTVAGVKVDLTETSANTELVETGSNIYGLCDDVQDGQILQCWCWSFDNIKKLLPQIAAQGFTAIQTSPIQPIKESTRESWSTLMNHCWVVYQPVAFNIETDYRNAFGTKAEFESMCEEAEKYGIKVIVDTIFNHTANDSSGNTIHPWVPSEIRNDSNCWHDISKDIYNFENRYDSTHYCLSGLPDLNTANSTVQKHCINFLKECIDAGADGFRFDAAKHIETPSDASGTKSDFWPNVLNAATEYAQETKGFTPYYYGELLGTPGGGLGTDAYTKYMSVTDTGANDIRQAVIDGNASLAAQSGISCGASPSKTVQWTESHDTYKDNGTRFISDHNINKTWAIVGARNEVCGLYLARPENIDTTMIGEADVTSWSNPEVKAVNKFKNHFAGQSEYMASSGSVAYIERGTSGVVLVNTGGTYYNNMSVPAHKIASGTYTDAITGNTFTVSNGYISGDIGDTGIAVVYDVESSGSLEKGSVTDFKLAGSFNGWSTSANVMVAKDSNIATTSVILEEGEYTFKIKGGDLWFGNSGTIEDETGSGGWTMKPDVSDNCTLKASGGKYTFSYNTVTQRLVVEHSESTESDVYLKGTFNDWDSSLQLAYEEGSNTVTTTLEIEKGTYSFKIHNRGIGSWYSNTGTIEDTTGSGGWTMKTSVDDNCTFIASGGKYTFSFNLSNNKLTVSAEELSPTQTTTQAEESENYPYYLMGEFNNWKDTDPFLLTDDADILTVTVEIEAGTYGFKLYKTESEKWYGNSGTINDTTGDNGCTMKEGEDKCTLVATGGTYTFTLTRSTKKLTVLYSPDEETPVETTTEAETPQYYLRGDFNDWSSSTPMEIDESVGCAVATIELLEGVYAFKVQDKLNSRWYGNNGTIEDSTEGKSWSMHQSAGDATLEATGGTYTFIFDTDEKRLTVNYVAEGQDPNTPDNPVLNDYTVTFLDYDGAVLDTQIVTEGSAAIPPADPVREGTDMYSYVFTGWDTSFVEITADTTVRATYEQKINEFEVTFLDYDGKILSIQYIPYGESALAPTSPVREGDAQYTYTFSGWDKDFTDVTEDLTVNALYSESVNEYNVTVNEGEFTFSGEKTVKYGDSYTFTVIPNEGYEIETVSADGEVLNADANGVYTVKNVTGDIEISVVVRKLLAENDFAGATVSLSGNIEVNFYMKLSDKVVADESSKLVFILPNGNTKTCYVKNAEKKDGYYVFACEVSAKEMASSLKARIVSSEYKSEVFEYSVKEYGEYILSSSDSKYERAKPLVKAMLNYGAYAQEYFGYNTENLANESLSESDKALADADFSDYMYSLKGEEEGVSYYGSKLSLKSETAIKHYFRIEDEENIPKCTVNDVAVTPVKKGEYYEIKVSDILAQNLDESIKVKAGEVTLEYSVLSYGYLAIKGNDTNLKNVVNALYAYNQAAKDYIG